MKYKNFTIDDIRKMANEISQESVIPYEDLPRYDLFLSQVTDYLNDKFKGEKYTNNIVQNYIKNEVISKPEDGRKRGYTKNHLVQLLLLSYMRPILTTEEIKKVFRLAFNEINDREDDIISLEIAYKAFSNIQQENYNNFLAKDYFNEKEFKNMIKEAKLEGEEEERIMVFIVVMNLIAEASVIKNIAKNVIDEYFNGRE
ncbi:DUF1836 domain-containing protein [Clostridium pasteurianum]|uniref:DUF1836 domain-containing protein n=1 Tax=Clostridium pasteurianum BC1 TaxID=86416 RepID=R4JYB1_CLOPA|nr:protein of unknown function (DUF1836) [Clostridium pasteurianum BC1]